MVSLFDHGDTTTMMMMMMMMMTITMMTMGNYTLNAQRNLSSLLLAKTSLRIKSWFKSTGIGNCDFEECVEFQMFDLFV